MKIFIDLGAYKGDSIDVALKVYKGFDRYYAFEPSGDSFRVLHHKFDKKRKIYLINAAADILTGKGKLFIGKDPGNRGASDFQTTSPSVWFRLSARHT